MQAFRILVRIPADRECRLTLVAAVDRRHARWCHTTICRSLCKDIHGATGEVPRAGVDSLPTSDVCLRRQRDRPFLREKRRLGGCRTAVWDRKYPRIPRRLSCHPLAKMRTRSTAADSRIDCPRGYTNPCPYRVIVSVSHRRLFGSNDMPARNGQGPSGPCRRQLDAGERRRIGQRTAWRSELSRPAGGSQHQRQRSMFLTVDVDEDRQRVPLTVAEGIAVHYLGGRAVRRFPRGLQTAPARPNLPASRKPQAASRKPQAASRKPQRVFSVTASRHLIRRGCHGECVVHGTTAGGYDRARIVIGRRAVRPGLDDAQTRLPKERRA